ncbi:hypothetical protein HYX16_05475 [Candidatus Woesearchaeota archaeon]|nr:hypothetical protein [Candidatus Woesearchaeota archaeon]
MVNPRIDIKYENGKFSLQFEDKEHDGTLFGEPKTYDGLINVLFTLYSTNPGEPCNLNVTKEAEKRIKELIEGHVKLSNLYEIINLQEDLAYFSEELRKINPNRPDTI